MFQRPSRLPAYPLPPSPAIRAQHFIDSLLQHGQGPGRSATPVIVLDSLGSPAKGGGTGYRWEVGDVAATGRLGNGISVGEAEVSGSLELDEQRIHPLLGNLPGGCAQLTNVSPTLESHLA
jgi:hypothetical protein